MRERESFYFLFFIWAKDKGIFIDNHVQLHRIEIHKTSPKHGGIQVQPNLWNSTINTKARNNEPKNTIKPNSLESIKRMKIQLVKLVRYQNPTNAKQRHYFEKKKAPQRESWGVKLLFSFSSLREELCL